MHTIGTLLPYFVTFSWLVSHFLNSFMYYFLCLVCRFTNPCHTMTSWEACYIRTKNDPIKLVKVTYHDVTVQFRASWSGILVSMTPDEQKALKRLKTDENIVILPADKGRVTVVMNKTDYKDKMDSLVNDKHTYEVLKRNRHPHCNPNLTTNCLNWRKPTRSTFDATTSWGVVFRSHPSCMDYQNCTNPTYLCGP